MDNYIEHYNERAGILEYDGGHTRGYAELLAFVETLEKYMRENDVPAVDAVRLLKKATGYSGTGNQVYLDGKQLL